MHVVQGIGLLPAAVVDEVLLFPGHALKYALLQQAAADCDQFAALGGAAQGEGEAHFFQGRIGSLLHDPLADQPQGDLWIGPFQYRTGQAQEHVAASVVAREATGRIGQIGGALEQARSLTIHVQGPAGFSREPFAQAVGLASHGGKVGMVR